MTSHLPRLRSLIRQAVLMTCGFSLALCMATLPGFTQVSPTSDDGTLQPQVLQVGTEADYIPFEYRAPVSGADEIIGFDIDIANYIAQHLGLELQVRDIPFDQLLPAVSSGELDFAIAAITPTIERAQTLDFSNPYYESRHALISRRSDPVRTLTDLVGKKVTVQSGSVQESLLLQRVGLNIEVTSIGTLNEMVSAIREGLANVAMVEELVAEAYLENNPTLEMDVLGELAPSPVAIAFPKDSPYIEDFNIVIADMRASGELDVIARRWFTANP